LCGKPDQGFDTAWRKRKIRDSAKSLQDKGDNCSEKCSTEDQRWRNIERNEIGVKSPFASLVKVAASVSINLFVRSFGKVAGKPRDPSISGVQRCDCRAAQTWKVAGRLRARRKNRTPATVRYERVCVI
jgi:hypothetical protein